MDVAARIVEKHAHPARKRVTCVNYSVIGSALPLIQVGAAESANLVEVIRISRGNVTGAEGRIRTLPARIQHYILVRGLLGSIIDNMGSCQDGVRPNNDP